MKKRINVFLCAAALCPFVVLARAASGFDAYELSGLKAKVGYFASKPLDAGDDGRVAVVIVPDAADGRTLPPEVRDFVTAAGSRTDGRVPYVVAPVFPQEARDGCVLWTDWADGGDATGATLSSLDVLETVVRQLNDRNRYPNLSRVVVAGAGAGGQLAGLYAAVGRGRDSNGVTLAFAAIAPTTMIRPETDLPWPRGLANVPRFARKRTREEVCDYLAGRRLWLGCEKAEDADFLADYPEWRKFVTVRTLGGSCRDAWRDAGLLDFILDDLPRQQAPWQVTVDGRELPLMTGRALRGVFSFASFEVKGGEKVVATAPDGKVERFTATGPFRRTFKPYGARNALALFGDAPETDVPDLNDPKVKWFGPGVHKAGEIRLTDGETLYLARGAVVHGALYAQGRDITVAGRGVLTGVDYPRCHGPFFFFTTFQGCTNLVIRGVTLTEPYHWTLTLFDCEKVLIEDIRICAGNMLNDDAIDPTNCRDVTMRGVFARAQDDIIALKGMQACPCAERTPCENFLIEDCTFWTDMANVFRIGYECNASHFANFTARNIDVAGYAVLKKPWQNVWPNVVFFLQPSNGMTIRDFLFEDIRVQSDGHDNLLVLAEPRVCGCFFPNGTGNPYDTTSYLDKYVTGGSLDGITFRNVAVTGVRGDYRGEIVVRGHSKTETVRNIRFENVTRFGERVTAMSPDVLVENAENVVFRP